MIDTIVPRIARVWNYRPGGKDDHEVARSRALGARIVHVGDDPRVLTRARAPLASRPEGATDYEADARGPETVPLGEPPPRFRYRGTGRKP